jgi:hypothetical protein
MRRPLRVVVAGMVAGVPGHGGATWAVLQWVLGLRALGHDVLLVEQANASPKTRTQFRKTARSFGLVARAALVDADTRQADGMRYTDLVSEIARCDVLVNLAGTIRDAELLGRAPRRVYVDLDPGFTQAWHSAGVDVGLDGHDDYVTVGTSVGRPHCGIPTLGYVWTPVLPPVALEWWSPRALRGNAITTIANWRSYGPVECNGVRLGQKAHAFRTLLCLPSTIDAPCQLALSIHRGDQRDEQALVRHGWRIIDPARVAGTPARYRRFVQGSLAELGVAKHGYVATRSGWFSDRSACYLATGRPVVAADTGIGDVLPIGAGLLTFTDVDEARDALHAVLAEPERHARQARRIAREHLAASVVLPELLDRIGVAA